MVTWNIHGEQAPLSAKFCLEGMSGAGGRRHLHDPSHRSWPIPRRPALPLSRTGQRWLRVRPAPVPVCTAPRPARDPHAGAPNRTMYASHPDDLGPAPRPHRTWPVPGLHRTRPAAVEGPWHPAHPRRGSFLRSPDAQPNFAMAPRTAASRLHTAPAPPPHPAPPGAALTRTLRILPEASL